MLIINNPESNIKKTNVFMTGSSGSGKTFLIETASKVLNIPLTIVDASLLSKSGYIGGNIEDIVKKAYIDNDYDKHKTEFSNAIGMTKPKKFLCESKIIFVGQHIIYCFVINGDGAFFTMYSNFFNLSLVRLPG